VVISGWYIQPDGVFRNEKLKKFGEPPKASLLAKTGTRVCAYSPLKRKQKPARLL
jgi:hypothetical protein